MKKKILILLIPLVFIAIIERAINLFILDKNLYGLDPYIFYRYAHEARQGNFHLNDTLRYYPNGISSLGYPMVWYVDYFLSYLTNSVILASQIYPVIAFIIGLIFMVLLFYYLSKREESLISVIIALAGSSQFLYRTIAGWNDKEPLGFMYFFMGSYFLIRFLEEKKYIYAILYAITTVLFIFTWGGWKSYAILMSIIFLFYFIKNIEKIDKKHLFGFIYYTIILLISLYAFPIQIYLNFFSKKILFFYFNFIKQTYFLMLLSPLFLIALLLIYKKYFMDKIKYKDKYLPFFAFLGFLTTIIFFDKILSLATYKVKYGISTVAESQPITSFSQFINYLGMPTVLLSLLFLILSSFFLFENIILSLISSVISLVFILFFIKSNFTISSILGTILVLVILILASIFKDKLNYIHAISIAIGILALLFPTKMIRLVFIGILFIIFQVTLSYLEIIKKFKQISIPSLILIILPLLPSISQNINAVKYLHPMVEGNYKNSLLWLKKYDPNQDLVYHWWDYGYWVQAIGNKKTIVDGGNVYWIRNERVARYMFNAKNEKELACLFKTYGIPKFIYIVGADVFKYYQMARWTSWLDKSWGKPVAIFTCQKQGNYSICGAPLDLLTDKEITLINKKQIYVEEYVLYLIEKVNNTYYAYLINKNNYNKIKYKINCICNRTCEGEGLFCIFDNKKLIYVFPYKIKNTFFVENFFLKNYWKGIKLIKEFNDLDDGVIADQYGNYRDEYVAIYEVNQSYFKKLINKLECKNTII